MMEKTVDNTGSGNSVVTERDSTTGDYNRLLTIFPDVVWRQVFQVLPNSEDLISVNNASPAFGKLLQRKKVEYLFPGVWDIVANKVHDEFASEILMLRLVTRSWKNGIDKSYTINELPPDFARIDGKYENAEKLYRKEWMRHEFRGETSLIRKFMTYFEPTHENEKPECSPFLSGHVSILTPNPFRNFPLLAPDPAFEPEISRLLQVYGRHIFRCEIVFPLTPVTVQRASNLRQWISCLPNIISLTITNFHEFVDPDEQMERDRNILLQLRPLPKLDKLECLYLHQIVPAVAKLLMESYNDVSILHLGTEIEIPYFEVTKMSFPNLKCLTISFGSFSEFKVLETANFSSAFRKLEIVFINVDDPPVQEIVTILARKWATTLDFLKITFNSRVTGRHNVNKEIEKLKQQYFPRLREVEPEVLRPVTPTFKAQFSL